MSSSDNKFSLLASLTTLPSDQNQQQDDDDNILPPLAVEEESGEQQPQVKSSNSNKVGGLLGSSGLLTSLGSTATAGGGLFDQLEEEERKAQEAEERRRIEQEEMERKRKIEAEKQRQEAALQMQREKEEAERAAVAAAAQAAAAAAVQESIVLPSNGSGSVMGGLQELSLNEDSAVSLGYRPEMNSYSNVMQGGVSNGGNYQNNGPQPQQSHYVIQNPPQQPPPQVPKEQQQMTTSMQQPVQQQQQIQQASYGASSYYYSTTGNVQQIHQQQPTTPVATNPPIVYSSTMGTPNDNGLASSSYAQRSQHLQSQNPSPVHPNNGMSPYFQHNTQMQLQNPQQQQQLQQQQPQQQFPSMHQSNGNNMNHLNNTLSKPKITPPPYNPDSFEPIFGPITVTDPILVQSPGVFSGPPHWIYNVVVRDMKKIDGQDQFSAVVSNVRRRFRHFVALEDRLRADCLGAILPPRPDKHPTRAIDEASARQSTQFALQRAKELETYLNALRLHPLAGKAQNLQLFLTLPDHIGAAWPEVSSSIFTRLTEVGTSTAVKISEGTNAVISELNNESQIMAGEDNSELLALASAEGLRIGSVLQGVPKIEGTVVIMGELGERMSVAGLEVQKLVNNVMAHEREFATPFEILSSGLLKSGRRTSRLAIELGAATQVFTLQYKLCRYERLAFADRRSALVRRRDSRLAADKKAQKLVVHQHSMQSMGHHSVVGSAERDAVMSDEVAGDAYNEAEKIGQILQCEVGRIADMRKKDWSMSLKVIAANMKEAHAERAAIWESCRDSFLAENNPLDNGHPHPEELNQNTNEVADSEVMN